jgi:hypothetical protein
MIYSVASSTLMAELRETSDVEAKKNMRKKEKENDHEIKKRNTESKESMGKEMRKQKGYHTRVVIKSDLISDSRSLSIGDALHIGQDFLVIISRGNHVFPRYLFMPLTTALAV